MIERDAHHILHEKYSWNSRPESAALRAEPTLIPTIPRRIHNEIHHHVPAVPLLPLHGLMRVWSRFEPGNNTMQSVDNLMMSIEQSTKHPKMRNIERDLCHLAVRAIDLQRPYLRQGITEIRRSA